MNPFGLMYHEVTASSLVKVDLNGSIVSPGSTQFEVNRQGYAIHSAIYAKRQDVKCVVHVHTTAGAAVSCIKRETTPQVQSQFCMSE